MLYSEFLEKTGFNEKHIPPRMYKTFIEPVYIDSVQSQNDFCRELCKAYDKVVNEPINAVIKTLPAEEVIYYRTHGHSAVFDYLEHRQEMLKRFFLMNLSNYVK